MNGPESLFPAAVAVRLGTMAMAMALGKRPAASRWVAFSGSALASVLTGLVGAAVLRGSAPVDGVLLVHAASGFSLGYTVDALSAWFLLVLALVGVPISLYSVGYLAHGVLDRRSPFVGAAFNVLVGAVELVLVADGVVAFLFAWELMTLATAALVVSEHEKRGNRRAAYLYLVMSHVGTGCLIGAFLLLAGRADSLAFGEMLGTGVSGGTRDLVFVLFLIAFGIKAGVIPLHVWLPEAHPAAPSSISALMSAVVIKTGIYGMFRFCAFGLGVPRLGWGVAILLLGGLSATLGVLYALMQHDLKRLLAYHSVENIGIILLGLGAGMLALSFGRGDLAAVGLAASLYHVVNHAAFKGLLFLGAGAVATATGTRDIEELGGLAKRMPWTALFFLLGAAAISGLPPLNGFVSEWLVFQAFLFGFHSSSQSVVRSLFPVGGALLALTSALAAACFVKAFGMAFLALPRSEAAERAREAPGMMLAPQAFLAALCVLLGLLPGLVLRTLEGVMAALPGVTPSAEMARGLFTIAPGPGRFDHVTPLVMAVAVIGGVGLAAVPFAAARYRVRRAPTWGCGGELSARTEYTATAFSKPLMMIFRAIYRPTREVSALAEVSPYYPREVRYRAKIEPTFERFVYGPLTRAVLAAAARMKAIQGGSIHAYLAYVIALVIVLVVLVWWRG